MPSSHYYPCDTFTLVDISSAVDINFVPIKNCYLLCLCNVVDAEKVVLDAGTICTSCAGLWMLWWSLLMLFAGVVWPIAMEKTSFEVLPVVMKEMS